ncbi:LacI family DNA-binding transcriptional regulator [Anaerosporobacter faecicola]|uniref:LacI family DNA-binding transcriptional regulator n=1 Tax=Anaerosporobacter faecicola TaxID=2718714 RepID=UPI00143B1E48|nr:LacI family DNA-binding transcriptional regulator [Anaerosporobacter faecicola]
MPITITDVAKEAGVSTSTVSKVLNNWTTISPATTKRVHQAIEKLNYIPNARAVSFARQSTKNIVFLTYLEKDSAYVNPHMFDIMCGAYSEISKNGFTMTLQDVSKDTAKGETISYLLSTKSCDGLIIHGSAISPHIAEAIIKQNFPHIIIGHPGFESRLCWVDTNHALAGQLAAQHMIEHGYSSLAFIGGQKTDELSFQRQKGFLGTMYQYGYQVPEDKVIYTTSTVDEGFEATKHLLSQPNRPRGIVCENNTLAIGSMKAIEQAGLSLPDDIAFLTFDAYPYSNIIDPKPTVIDIDVFDMGAQAGSMMIRKLENPSLLVQSFTTIPVIHSGQTT